MSKRASKKRAKKTNKNTLNYGAMLRVLRKEKLFNSRIFKYRQRVHFDRWQKGAIRKAFKKLAAIYHTEEKEAFKIFGIEQAFPKTPEIEKKEIYYDNGSFIQVLFKGKLSQFKSLNVNNLDFSSGDLYAICLGDYNFHPFFINGANYRKCYTLNDLEQLIQDFLNDVVLQKSLSSYEKLGMYLTIRDKLRMHPLFYLLKLWIE